MYVLFEWFSAGFSQAICWTLIHSIWLGLIAAVVAAFIVMVTKRSAGATRYNLLMAVLLLFVLSTGITLYRQMLFHTTASDLSATVKQGAIADSQINFGKNAPTGMEVSVPQSLISRLNTYFDQHASFIVLIWFLLFLIKCTQLASGLHYIWRIRHRRNNEVSREWRIRLAELAEQIGIKRAIVFLESELVNVPTVIGSFKPLLLVPAGLLTSLPAHQVETILLHELAHIRRKDFLVNLLQSFVDTFFFFNPALVWISSLIREEREACCDDAVIANMPQKANYVQALISFQELNFCAHAQAMALTGKKNHLFNRVKRMITQENKKLNLMEKTVLLFSIIAITAFGFITKKAEKIVIQPIVVHKEVRGAVLKKVSTFLAIPQIKKQIIKKEKSLAGSSTRKYTDTVPQINVRSTADTSRRFSSISSNINNDGNKVVSLTEATDNNGTTYRIKRVDGQMTELLVNGTAIPKNVYSEYDNIIRQIDETQRQHIARKNVAIEKKNAALAAKHKELFKKREILARKNSIEREGRLKMKSDILKQNQLKMAERKKVFQLKDSQRKLEQSQKKREFAQKQRLFKAEHAGKTNGDINNIIHDLNNYNLISNTESLSFSLNNNELIVNGMKQSAEIYQKLKEKYIQDPGDRFNYSKKGNTTNITISRD